MTKLDRVAAALAGTGMEDQAAILAARPAGEVDVIVRALRASRRAGRDDDRAARTQRHKDRRTHGWATGARLLKAVEGLVTGSLVPRAALDLETLAGLNQHYKRARAVLGQAVAGARERYSDEEIARALGVSRQAVEDRFPRPQPATPASP